MDIFHAIILGIVEGITEFLPVSSTGHMIVVSDWLGIDRNAQHTAFEIIIQFAAIFAVIASYTEKFHSRYFTLWVKVFIAFLPLAAVGFLFSDTIESLFNPHIVAWMFIIGGVIFLIVEHFYREDVQRVRNMEDLSYTQAAWVGFAQLFALVPGTSRAGATIIGGMLAGLDRKSSTEFSFLLALPVLGASSGYSLLKHYEEFATTSFTPLIVGFVVAFVVAYLTMKVFIGFLERFTFRIFGVYRILFGLLLLWWLA